MNRNLFLISLALLIWGIGEGLFYNFLPIYLYNQWNASPVLIGLLLGATGFTMMVLQTPSGYLADRWGARPLLWFSWILGVLATWVMALAHSLHIFVFGLLLYGFSSSIIAAINSYITNMRGDWSVERALNTAYAFHHLGFIIGPIAGGIIGDRSGLQVVFLIAAVIFIFSTLTVFLVQPDQPAARAEETQVRPRLSDRRFLIVITLIFLSLFVTYLPQPLTPNFLQNEQGLSLTVIGQLLAISQLGNVVISLVFVNLKALSGLILGQLFVGIFALAIWRGDAFVWYGIGYFFSGGYRLCRSMALALVHSIVKKTEIGFAYGLVETVNAASLILAPPVAGLLYDINPNSVYTVSLVLLGVMLAVHIGRSAQLKQAFRKLFFPTPME